MNNPIRVLFVVPRFGTVNRGVEAFALELIARMDPSVFSITLLSGPHNVSIPKVSFEKGRLLPREKLAWLDRSPSLVRCLRLLGFGSAAEVETLSLVRRYRRHWQQNVFDIVVPQGGTWSYRFARNAFPASRIVSIGHAGPIRIDLELSDVFVALTPYDEARARKMRPGVLTCVISNGVDSDRFLPVAAKSSAPRGLRRVILCVAALVRDKRHDLLFDAVMRLPEYVSVRCVGAGPLLNLLQEHPLAKAGRVEFSQCSLAEMPEVYRRADVFSLASPDEAFGLVFLEAMASGLPVVANKGPRQSYVVNGGGVLCNVFDTNAYARALTSVLDSAPSIEARTQGMRFAWHEVAAQYTKLFLDLGERRHS
jgi:glycosyltransferase involved in cell wall biosynthesis